MSKVTGNESGGTEDKQRRVQEYESDECERKIYWSDE